MNTPTPCSATTRAGNPCRFSARKGSGLCVNHDPTYADQQRDNRNRGSAASKENRQLRHFRIQDLDLSNRSAVQGIVDATLRLVLNGQITEARAAQVIRLLSLAIRNFGAVRSYQVPSLPEYDYQRTRAIEQIIKLIARTHR